MYGLHKDLWQTTASLLTQSQSWRPAWEKNNKGWLKSTLNSNHFNVFLTLWLSVMNVVCSAVLFCDLWTTRPGKPQRRSPRSVKNSPSHSPGGSVSLRLVESRFWNSWCMLTHGTAGWKFPFMLKYFWGARSRLFLPSAEEATVTVNHFVKLQ